MCEGLGPRYYKKLIKTSGRGVRQNKSEMHYRGEGKLFFAERNISEIFEHFENFENFEILKIFKILKFFILLNLFYLLIFLIF